MAFGKLPRTVEYALKILICLTIFAGRPLPASAVATLARIPVSQASKVLNYLNLRGLTRSRRGSHGGYQLRTNPEGIYVKGVIELFQPVPEEDTATDPLSNVWSQMSARFWDDVENLTIAELARRTAAQFEIAV